MEPTICEMPPQSARPVASEEAGCHGRLAEDCEAGAETADEATARSEHRPLNTAEVEKRLEDAIVRRTHGLVRSPRVRAVNGALVLDGFAMSYYAVQLALAAMVETLDRLGCDRPGEIQLAIDVLAMNGACAQGQCSDSPPEG